MIWDTKMLGSLHVLETTPDVRVNFKESTFGTIKCMDMIKSSDVHVHF